jgi:hypothetical protein
VTPFWSVLAPGYLGRGVGRQPHGSLEDSPPELRNTGEWNTTSVPIQSRGTWDSIREAEKPAWPGSQTPSGQCQHWVTWAWSWWTPPRTLEDSFWGRPHFNLQTTGHLPCQRRGIFPAQEGFARAPGGTLLVPRSLWDWSAQVRVWTTEANNFWDRPPGRSEGQISVQLPCKRRACLQRVLQPLKLRRELVSKVCW